MQALPLWRYKRVSSNILKPINRIAGFYILKTPIISKHESLRFLGAKINKTASIMGPVDIGNPRNFQINGGNEIQKIKIRGNSFCLVDFDSEISRINTDEDCICSGKRIVPGKRIETDKITFSIDVEAGVGLSHVEKAEFENKRKLWDMSKNSSRRIYDIFEKYEIPATWAFCGHLFLERCTGKHPFSEKDWYGDWFRFDPKSDWQRDPGWYMPDFIQDVLDTDIFNIGYHSFGHFDYLKVKKETVEMDMIQARKLRKEMGIKMEEFVFPYNTVGHVNTIVSNGFRKLRGIIGTGFSEKTVRFDGFDFAFTSNFLSPFYIKTKRIRTKSLCGVQNIFTHPFNWTSKEDFEILERYIKGIRILADTGNIKIGTI